MKPNKIHLKQAENALYEYLKNGTSFHSQRAFLIRNLYFPLCSADAKGIKSSITPRLSGDIKINKDCYLTKPASTEDLRLALRNFFCFVQGKGVFSLAGGKEDGSIEAGMLWHKLSREHKDAGLVLEALNFVPVTGEDVELMRITVTNRSNEKRIFTPTFSLPIFGRTLANKHDHEHVTSLLHRIEQLPHGVCVEPTMVFDERGHKPNKKLYYVLGIDANGDKPSGTFPTIEQFCGDEGDLNLPDAVVNNIVPTLLPKELTQGKEAVGALRFKEVTLAPGASQSYLIVMGIGSSRGQMQEVFSHFCAPESFEEAFVKNGSYWKDKTQSIQFLTGDGAFNTWMRWVTLQPILRRIFGCSFLPDHDYGKGGRGWRDIWQDLLSLILIEPQSVRRVLIDNFAGVRVDGSNATIIGDAPGEFIADRNSIARVWMDHGVWPFTTLLLYINQTGDYDILLEENTYFRDAHLSRAFKKDYAWSAKNGNFLTDKNDKTYRGTIIEHVLIEHLVQFFNVGEHNITRLENADWNDGFDMAGERGESVAFMSFYGGNFLRLAGLLEDLAKRKNIKELRLALEVRLLFDSLTDAPIDYDDAAAKKKFLFDVYFPSVQPEVSGGQATIPIQKIAEDLRKKGNWIFNRIREYEKVKVQLNNETDSWFNGYYDNNGERVEGIKDGHVRMTLMGQVFPLMSGLADQKEGEDVIKSVRRHLKDKKLNGVRLNTDFNVPHYMELGRSFGFAYGTKENGAFFSHMTVMYANGLYKMGFIREGYDVIQSVYRMCVNTVNSKIYPGIPEYFNSEGRGYYHYLTGAASWLVLTQLTQVFGVRGEGGDLVLAPQLVKEEFDPKTGGASVMCNFAGKKITVTYENPGKLDAGAYAIDEVILNGAPVAYVKEGVNIVRIERELLESGSSDCALRVILSKIAGS